MTPSATNGDRVRGVEREALGPLAVLSHDDRVRANAAALGLELIPSGNW